MKLGCGCSICQQPLPRPPFPAQEENAKRVAAYRFKRFLWRKDHPLGKSAG